MPQTQGTAGPALPDGQCRPPGGEREALQGEHYLTERDPDA